MCGCGAQAVFIMYRWPPDQVGWRGYVSYIGRWPFASVHKEEPSLPLLSSPKFIKSLISKSIFLSTHHYQYHHPLPLS